MATFNTHFTAATVSSTLAASCCLSLNLLPKSEVIALWFIGVIGGLLPDIDSDDSSSIRLMFNLLGLSCALVVGAIYYRELSIVGLWIVGAMAYAIVRYGLIDIFERFTVHRGSMHSLLCCLMFSAGAANLFFYTGSSSIFAWSAASFVMIGMLTHLLMDELYSVDLAGMEFKRSFGSALKPLSIDYPLSTGLQLLLCAVFIYFAPPIEPIVKYVTQTDIRFLPLKEWAMIKGWFS